MSGMPPSDPVLYILDHDKNYRKAVTQYVSLRWGYNYKGEGEFSLEMPVGSKLADPQSWLDYKNRQYRSRFLSDGNVVMFPEKSTRRRESDTVVIEGSSIKASIHRRAIINGPVYNIVDPRELLEGLVRTAVGESGTGSLVGRALPVRTRFSGPSSVQGDARNFEYSGKYIEDVEEPLENMGRFWTRMEMFDYILDRTPNDAGKAQSLSPTGRTLVYGYGGSVSDYEVTMNFLGVPRGSLALHRKDGDPKKRMVAYARGGVNDRTDYRVGPFYTELVFDATDFYKWDPVINDDAFRRTMEGYARDRLKPNNTRHIGLTVRPKTDGGVDLVPGDWYYAVLPELSTWLFCEKVTRSYSPSGVFQDAVFNEKGVFLGY